MKLFARRLTTSKRVRLPFWPPVERGAVTTNKACEDIDQLAEDSASELVRASNPGLQLSREANPQIPASLILDQTSDGVLIADMGLQDEPIVHVNSAFELITGYTSAEVLGKNCRYLQGNDRLQPEVADIRAALAQGQSCSVTLRNYKRDGTIFRSALRLLPLRDEAGKITHFIGFIRDVTHVAGVDRLTGQLDRYGLLDRLAKVSTPQDCSLLLVKLDIVRFHDVNNGFGYDVGDDLLCSVAARLGTVPALAVARMGPNSFALAIALQNPEGATAVVDSILDLLKPTFILPGASLAIQFAVGFAVDSPGVDPLQIVRQAGAALQRSKASPAYKPHAFATADERSARSRIRLAGELQTAVVNQELLFYYQPQVDLATRDLVGAEALLRWNHGTLGLQPPSRFINLAEETGALVEMGAWGLRTLAAKAAQINQGRRAPIRFALNVSALEFMRRDIVADVKMVVAEVGCSAEWLTLELTESLMISEPERIRRAFRELRDIGVEISIDDFGTGYSSLRYVESFPVSEIKIDKSFVQNATESAAKRVIVEGVVKLGAALGVRIVAEGIESEAEHALMQSLGCSTGQGYLFAPPMDAADFHTLVGKREIFIETLSRELQQA